MINWERFKSREFQWALAIFLIALVIRFIGLHWGLANGLHNQSYHPDEEVNWRYAQAIDPAHLKFTPGFYGYGTLYFTFLKVASDVTAAYGGAPKGPNDWEFIARCEFAGRCLSMVFGAGLALCGFLAAKRVSNLLGGIAAGFLIAFAPGLVVHSRFATVDMLAAFMLGLCTVESFVLLEEKEWTTRQVLRVCAFAGLWAGLSAGTKYTGIIGIIIPIVILIAMHRKRWLLGSACVIGAALIAFVVSTPGCILDSSTFLRDVAFEMSHSASGHGLVFAGTSNGFLYQLSNLFLGVGTLSILGGFGYLFFKCCKKSIWAWALLGFVLPTYFLIGRSEVKFYRYSIPLALPAAIGIGCASAEADRTKLKGRCILAYVVFAVVGLDGGGLRGAVTFTAPMVSADPRDLAATYIKSVSNASTTVGFASDPWFWSAPLYPNTGLVRMVPFPIRERFRLAATNPKVLEYVPAVPDDRVQFDSRLITDMKPDYVVFSDFESLGPDLMAGLGNPSHSPEVDQYSDFMKLLVKKYKLVEIFGYKTDLVEDMRYAMPTLYLWKKNPGT